MEITCRSSNYKSSWYPTGVSVQGFSAFKIACRIICLLIFRALKLVTLAFPCSNFLTDCYKAVLLYLFSSLTICLVCVLQPCGHLLGKGLRPSSPVWLVQCMLDPLFWQSLLSAMSLCLVLAHFSLTLPLILFNHATIY